MARVNWRQVADRLAGRLMYHSGACPDGHQAPESWCPSCEDIRAYEEYVAAGGTVGLPDGSGTFTPISQITTWVAPPST